ncbi:MAG TPA: PIN domain-containing protein [Rickettsia endosymbiont of Proechinophthirus fluctus]|uniref:PIN domain-containing protein n=1 Tax=Rickettsia endosymbiont of Proechinophthirus fluctus TaxID=1462733 RepID=UPI000789C563|nr:PIN domain-containing protein [Rickettsia endosymbiont of Proechinophthirus fluctus]KYP97942.1 cation:proton antiporter [Rickettsia endosymbiont of Proechinophthirus fluctus]HJD54339.1 PIN domain-containing protein [Rickettsia endosymbiont of Proechinophthirus fluctus]
MGLIIDTAIIIALEREKVSTQQWSPYGQTYISPIVLTELLIGVDRVKNENKRIKCLAFIEYVLPFGLEEVYTYARITHDLYTQRITIGTHDMLIAATAITKDFLILTLNVKDFKRIQELEVLTVSSKD